MTRLNVSTDTDGLEVYTFLLWDLKDQADVMGHDFENRHNHIQHLYLSEHT